MKAGRVSLAILTVSTVCLAFLWGCASVEYKALVSDEKAWQKLQKHMLNIDTDGRVDTRHSPKDYIYKTENDLKPWSERDCRMARSEDKKVLGDKLSWSIDRIMEGFDNYAQKHYPFKQARVMLIFHGGLVSIKDGVVQAKKVLDAMDRNKNRDFYPIFVNWETGPGNSYSEHLFRVRNGARVDEWQGYPTAPFVLIVDAVRAVSRLPKFLWDQSSYFFTGKAHASKFVELDSKKEDSKRDKKPVAQDDQRIRARRVWERSHEVPRQTNDQGVGLRTTYVYYVYNGEKKPPPDALYTDKRIPKGWEDSVTLPDYTDDPPRSAPEIIMPWVPGFLRVVTTFIVDAGGTGAYENMLRRTQLLINQDKDFGAGSRLTCGALSRLMAELRAYEQYKIKGLPQDESGSRNRGNDIVTRLRALQVHRRSLPYEETKAIDSWMEELRAIESKLDETIKVEKDEQTAIKRKIGELTTIKAEIDELGSIESRIDELTTILSEIDELRANASRMGERIAIESKIDKLRAIESKIDKLRAHKDEMAELRAIDSQIEQLSLELKDDTKVLPITVIGHSMGGIVTNELLHQNSDLYFDNVVYMAAANSTKNLAALALPYLEANPTTRFYSLTLHPYREANEVSLANTLPEGSLLSWLDRFVINSRSKLDHTMGTWNNTAQSLPIMAYLEGDVRKRFTVKVFDLCDGTPQKHGDFNEPPCYGTDDQPCYGTDDLRCSNCPQKKGYTGGIFWEPKFWGQEREGECKTTRLTYGASTVSDDRD